MPTGLEYIVYLSLHFCINIFSWPPIEVKERLGLQYLFIEIPIRSLVAWAGGRGDEDWVRCYYHIDGEMVTRGDITGGDSGVKMTEPVGEDYVRCGSRSLTYKRREWWP